MAPTDPYDALLLVSFGGPEAPEDVVPFLQNVTRGRGIPRARLEEVGEHYFAFGGRSPINDQCRALLGAIRADLDAAGIALPLYWGNRNWHPLLADTLRAMAADGVRRVACFVTSAYSSYSGCRQYREDLYDATAAAGAPHLRIDRLRHYHDHPGFIRPFVDATLDALGRLAPPERAAARLVFVTHSIPTAMAAASGPDGDAYVVQHERAAALVAQAVAERDGQRREWDLVYCSRSGSPGTPWLEPDVNEHLEQLASSGAAAVVLLPVGFVSDHMEVAYDLDTQARATAVRLGLPMSRAATPGTHPAFVAMVRDLLLERAAAERGERVPRATLRADGASAAWDRCPVGCCRNPRGDRPALGGADAPTATPSGVPAQK